MKFKSYHSSYDSLAEAWVKGEVTGEVRTPKNRMFGDLGAVYSYGPHFCIARRWQSVGRKNTYFLLTERRYSNTTETHKSAVYSALWDYDPIMLPQVDNLHEYGLVNGTDEDLGKAVYETECKRLDNFLTKYNRMLRPHNEEYLLERVRNSSDLLNRFGLTLPDRLTDKAQSAQNHFHARYARNAVLDATAHARYRLLAA
jgi:hypothetical protein